MGTCEYADDFRMTFSEPGGFLDFLRERNKRTQWRRWQANELSYATLDENDDVSGPHGDYSPEEWKAIAEDTRRHTRLVMQTEYGNIPIRDCAVRSMLQRADISGKALPRLDKAVYARVLNYCMEVAQGNALVCISDGKVSAVHSGDGNGYTVLEISELVKALLLPRQRPRKSALPAAHPPSPTPTDVANIAAASSGEQIRSYIRLKLRQIVLDMQSGLYAKAIRRAQH